jgi:hypothetical protein
LLIKKESNLLNNSLKIALKIIKKEKLFTLSTVSN